MFCFEASKTAAAMTTHSTPLPFSTRTEKAAASLRLFNGNSSTSNATPLKKHQPSPSPTKRGRSNKRARVSSTPPSTLKQTKLDAFLSRSKPTPPAESSSSSSSSESESESEKEHEHEENTKSPSRSSSSSHMSYLEEPHSPEKNRFIDFNAHEEADQVENNADNINNDTVSSFKVPAAVVNESVSSTRCEVSQTSVGLASESILDTSTSAIIVNGREESDSAATAIAIAANNVTDSRYPLLQQAAATNCTAVAAGAASVQKQQTKEIKSNEALRGQQPPVNVKQV